MPLELRLAWRNVWRNPRRTALTVAATVFAVTLVVFFTAMAAGVHEKMIEDSVRVHSGHLNLSGAGYFRNRTLAQFVELDGDLVHLLDRAEGIRGWAPRVIGFALVSKEADAHGVGLLGVDPSRESSVSTLADRVKEGEFVSSARLRGIVLGRRLARNLGAAVGDEVLLYSQAYSLETAYDLFTVVGIMHLPEPALDRQMAVISLDDAQEFFVYAGRVSELAILTDDADAAPGVKDALSAALGAREGSQVELHLWSELMPELVQFIVLDDAGMYLMLMILVVVVAFGILNTILMAVLERARELGVLLALGLRPAAVFRVVFLESLILAGVGLVIGMAIGIATTLWFQANPIVLESEEFLGMMELVGAEPMITWKLKPLNPIGSALTILAVGSLAALYPAWKASRGRPVDALRSL